MIKHLAVGTATTLLMSGAANAAETGLWIGDIALCADMVSDAKISIDEVVQEPLFNLKLTGDATKRLAELTRRSVGKSISIRIDGVMLSEPNVWEPIYNGEIQITGIEPADMDKIIAATQRPCPVRSARLTAWHAHG